VASKIEKTKEVQKRNEMLFSKKDIVLKESALQKEVNELV